MIPLLLKPKWLSFRNAVRASMRSPQATIRNLVLLGFAFFVAGAIHRGTQATIVKLRESVDVAYIPSSTLLGVLFMFILAMLLLSGLVNAIGTLFHARDLDLIVASPLSPYRIFVGKLTEVALSSSWLVFIFGMPALIAFGQAHSAGLEYYGMILVTLPPFFLIPSAISICIAILFASTIPITRTREIMGVVTVLSFLGLLLLFRLLVPSASSLQDANAMLKVVSFLLVPNGLWSPSYWTSAILGSLLDGRQSSVMPHLLLLYSSAIALCAIAFILFRFGFLRAYSMARVQRIGTKVVGIATPSLLRYLPIPRPYQAIIAKEFRVFARDMTQALQLLMLLGICLIYLYNLRILHTAEGIGGETQVWWQGFLSLTNVCLGAFVISAMCTRLVFPSISLEGQSYWILQTSPLSATQVLRAKFIAWFIPVAMVGSITFSAGALAINADPLLVLLNIFVSWVMSAGIVGLAVGLGAYFANFDWEHPSQLVASFGSLVFMLLSVMLILFNLLPPSLLVFLKTQSAYATGLSEFQWRVSILCTIALLTYLNLASIRWSLSIGAQALANRRE